MDNEPGGDKDDGITVWFEKGVTMPVPYRTLEALSPSLKAMLYECECDCSVKLSIDSLKAWELMLHHLDPDCMYDDVSDEIERASADTITKVIRMCKIYKIPVLTEMIDETTAVGIEVSQPCSVHQPRSYELDYIKVDLEDPYFKIVRKNYEMIDSEEALAHFLVQVIKTNEKRLEARIVRTMSRNAEEWELAMESIHSFVEEMHDAGRYRFCSFFAERSMSERVNTSVASILD